jgi:site-specific recombinase XerD
LTRRAYAVDALRFLQYIGKPMRDATLTDLQGFAASLTGAAKSSARTLGAVKSLLTFGQTTGYLQWNVGKALKIPPFKDTLTERILSEEEAFRLLTSAPAGRDRVLLRLIYAAGIRVSELCGLSWCDVQPRDESGQITVYGKRGKTRTVLLPTKGSLWADLLALRGASFDGDPVFLSRTGKRMEPTAVWRVVKKAARLAGISRPVSPHWFRHSHATHAMDRGAPIHLVKTTLGHDNIATTDRYVHARPNESSATFLAAV